MAKEPANWFRRLQDDRLEVSLRADGVKLRASGAEATIYELVEWFEGEDRPCCRRSQLAPATSHRSAPDARPAWDH